MVDKEVEDQKIKFKIRHSLGAGIGYRFTEAFNLRFEPKVHIYEAFYNNDQQIAGNRIAEFTTYTLGFGAYYRWMPFSSERNLLRGITIVPSVRYWYKIASTLHNNELSYYNRATNKNEVLTAPNIGIANTPWLVNISIGYTFR